MDPDYEQRLREEVIYLHSLWHQGPPRPNIPKPNLTTLHPRNPIQFKKRGIRPLGKRNKTLTESLDSGIEWPCKITPDLPPATDSGWPSVRVPSNSEPRSLTPEEQARLASDQAQKVALKTVSEFLSHRDNADDECIDEVEEEDQDVDDTTEGEGCTKLEFFVKLFKDDSALREYYEKNNAGGEFSCLVCYALGKRGWKRYKDCVALVQHSISITKTKSRQSHRAYGQAICNILGWDINRLPSSIVSIDNKLGPSSNNLVEGQVITLQWENFCIELLQCFVIQLHYHFLWVFNFRLVDLFNQEINNFKVFK